MPKVSIVIPVYNVEKLLDRCIKSLLNQTYKDYELIFIDDGSKDNSLKILEKYKQNKKIKILTQKNNGPAITRNRGIKLAKGEYIMFVDSDDYVSPCIIEVLLKGVSAEKCQIAALTGGVDF